MFADCSSFLPFLLITDLLQQVGLLLLCRVLVFDHVVVLARSDEDRQDEYFIKLGGISESWQWITQPPLLLHLHLLFLLTSQEEVVDLLHNLFLLLLFR